jgi:hypothetical protein
MIEHDMGVVVGDDGISPSIEIEEDTSESYILKLQDAVREIKTPNLRCQALALIIHQVQELLDEFNVDLDPVLEKLDQLGTLPTGGSVGQILEKTGVGNFDAQWKPKPDISGKADKVSNAVNNNFAGLNSSGNLTDSGKKAADFVQMTGDQTVAGKKTFSTIPELPASDPTTDNQAARKAYVDSKITAGNTGSDDSKADKVSNAVNNNFAGLNSSGNLIDSGKKTADFVQMTGAQTVAGVKTFTSIPLLPASNPIADNEAVRKAYVDGIVTSGGGAPGAPGAPGEEGKGIKNVTANITSANLPAQGWRVGDMLWPGDTDRAISAPAGSPAVLAAYTLYEVRSISAINVIVESRGYLKGADDEARVFYLSGGDISSDSLTAECFYYHGPGMSWNNLTIKSANFVAMGFETNGIRVFINHSVNAVVSINNCLIIHVLRVA